MNRFSKLFLAMMLLCSTMFGQNTNKVWMSWFGTGMDFNTAAPTPFFNLQQELIWRCNASISDSSGNLLFYTNGYNIYNKNHEVMLNGDSLNLGDYAGNETNWVTDAAVIVPMPDSTNKYYLIHPDLKTIYIPSVGQSGFFSYNVFYDVIDMSLDSGLGAVESNNKEVLLFTDTLTDNGFQAVRHGNGRDWWIICHEYNSNRYYRFLVDPTGIHGPYTQDIGQVYTSLNGYSIFSNMKISPQGDLFIKCSSDSTQLEIYNFDRCTGELSNRKQIQVSDTLFFTCGISISPRERFAYVSANFWKYLYQFDLWANDIEASRKLIAIYDGSFNPFETNFYDQALAPDGKIYVCNYNGNYSLHVINIPDSLGDACNFVQNQYSFLPEDAWATGFPNYVNYSLGALPGSICDTLSGITYVSQIAFTYGVYPNPCLNECQLNITGVSDKVAVVIYNTFGEVKLEQTIVVQNGFAHESFNLSGYPAGVYLLNAITNRGQITEKIVHE